MSDDCTYENDHRWSKDGEICLDCGRKRFRFDHSTGQMGFSSPMPSESNTASGRDEAAFAHIGNIYVQSDWLVLESLEALEIFKAGWNARDQEVERLENENKRLNRIILKELTENDELGCEFTYVNTLREENKMLRGALEKIVATPYGFTEDMQEIAHDALKAGGGE